MSYNDKILQNILDEIKVYYDSHVIKEKFNARKIKTNINDMPYIYQYLLSSVIKYFIKNYISEKLYKDMKYETIFDLLSSRNLSSYMPDIIKIIYGFIYLIRDISDGETLSFLKELL